MNSIRRFTSDYEIIVINSGSGFWGDLWLNRQRRAGDLIVVLDDGRIGGKRVRSQSYFYNLGYRLARGEYVIHFADDCQALPNWTKDVVRLLDSIPDTGLALFYGQPHRFGGFEHTVYHGTVGGQHLVFPVAHWFCARRVDLEAIGFLDEDYDYYCNDLDVAVRMIVEANKRVLCSTEAKILHMDKSLVFREKVRVRGDIDRFNRIWADRVGFRVDDERKAEVIGEGGEERLVSLGVAVLK